MHYLCSRLAILSAVSLNCASFTRWTGIGSGCLELPLRQRLLLLLQLLRLGGAA